MLSYFEVNAWQTAYHDALRETDPARLHNRVEAAEEAMYKRLQELSYRPSTRGSRVSESHGSRSPE